MPPWDPSLPGFLLRASRVVSPLASTRLARNKNTRALLLRANRVTL
jgi:hypothetical protein